MILFLCIVLSIVFTVIVAIGFQAWLEWDPECGPWYEDEDSNWRID